MELIMMFIAWALMVFGVAGLIGGHQAKKSPTAVQLTATGRRNAIVCIVLGLVSIVASVSLSGRSTSVLIYNRMAMTPFSLLPEFTQAELRADKSWDTIEPIQPGRISDQSTELTGVCLVYKVEGSDDRELVFVSSIDVRWNEAVVKAGEKIHFLATDKERSYTFGDIVLENCLQLNKEGYKVTFD